MGKPSMMLSLLGFGWEGNRKLFPFSLAILFFQRVFTHPPYPATMPSKYMVSVSLDSVTVAIWEGLPIGERSKRVREALAVADLVVVKDGEIENLQNQTMRHINLIRKLQMSNQELRAFGCMCVVGNVSVGDLE